MALSPNKRSSSASFECTSPRKRRPLTALTAAPEYQDEDNTTDDTFSRRSSSGTSASSAIQRSTPSATNDRRNTLEKPLDTLVETTEGELMLQKTAVERWRGLWERLDKMSPEEREKYYQDQNVEYVEGPPTTMTEEECHAAVGATCSYHISTYDTKRI
jgi:hypothetical protein